MDQQIAKNLSKYYDDKGYILPKYQLSWQIGSRCFGYWVKYLFIRRRSTTDSKKCKLFMRVNALGMWSSIFCFGLMLIGKMFI